jgi:hypothetical protein
MALAMAGMQGDTPTRQFPMGVATWSNLPSHGHDRGGGYKKFLKFCNLKNIRHLWGGKGGLPFT